MSCISGATLDQLDVIKRDVEVLHFLTGIVDAET